MTMNLKLVTWKGDLTQFIVNAPTETDAIQQAILANFDYAEFDDDEWAIEDMKNEKTYTCEEVNLHMLSEILKRDDFIRFIDGVIVLND